jgi:hypothetical protein
MQLQYRLPFGSRESHFSTERNTAMIPIAS